MRKKFFSEHLEGDHYGEVVANKVFANKQQLTLKTCLLDERTT